MRKLSLLCAALLLTWMASDVSAGGFQHGGHYGHSYGGGFYNRFHGYGYGYGYGYPYAVDPSAYAAFQVAPSVRTVEYYVPVPQVRYASQVIYSAPQPELNVQPLPAYQPAPVEPRSAPAYDPPLQPYAAPDYAAPGSSVIALEVQQGYLTTRTINYLQGLDPFARFAFLSARYGSYADRLFTRHFGRIPGDFHSRFATRSGALPRSDALPGPSVLPQRALPRTHSRSGAPHQRSATHKRS